MVRDTILILEEDDDSRAKLTEIFQGKYKVLAFSNEKDGIEILRTQAASLAVVLVNLMIPARDDFQVLRRLSEKMFLSRIPFIMITSEQTTQYEKRGYEYGIVSYIKKPFHTGIIKQLVDNVVEVFQYKMELELTVKTQTEKLKKQNAMLKKMAEKQRHMNEVLIESLSNVVEFRNLESEQHIKRIRAFTICLGRSVMKLYPEYELTEEKLDIISWASSLHDIGKIVIPDNIILKAGKLTADEYEIIKSHTTKGAEILERVLHIDSKVFSDYAYDIARHHHEKYDGNGYPDGLKGEEISIAAQIVSLVDVYDALTSRRVYKAAYETEKAYQMIINGQSGIFSSKLLNAFTEAREEFEKIVKNYCDD
ncbi:MAG: HD domain-containing protein [Lachnospiraceae bacterium]|nr:HD domain-containing protein [Lachnospiraceae bacterium]